MYNSLEKITSLIGARRSGDKETEINWLLTDSRSLAFPETTLFFALRTRLGDGHKYIADLYRRGVRCFVVETLPEDFEKHYPEATFLHVINPLKALQRLSERHRERFSLPVVGITGSNGKTIVKEWLYQLLSPSSCVTRSPRSFNSQVGVPLSVWHLDERSEIGLFEAGISLPDEMPALRAIIQPTIGIMTNIGQAHQENFRSLKEKCLEKLSLFKDAKVLIYNGDDALISECVKTAPFSGEVIAWSCQDTSAPLHIRSITPTTDGHTHITYTYLQQEAEICIPFSDDASIQNSLHCLAACLYLNLASATIAERMAQLEPVAMRLEVKQGVRGCTLINDTYNSDVQSLDIALDFMNRRPGKHKTLILSDILQTGMSPEELYAQVAEMVSHRHVSTFIGIGPEICRAQKYFNNQTNKHFFESTDALIESGILESMSRQVVLLKGSRNAGFERLSDILSLRVHATTLEINLEAVTENLNFYRSFMQPETKMVCMVKASAYGAGSTEVAKTLQDRGVDYLAVAVADEGVELRKAGITANIIIMNPEQSAFSTLFAYNLEPEVYSFKLLSELLHTAKKEGISHFPCHIKLDTGMRRLGFDPANDMERLIDMLNKQEALIPRSVFSHFVGSDSPDFDSFSARQFALFDTASQKLQKAFKHRILRHICNSAAIERFPERHLDMVRLGLGLYGVDPVDNRRLHNISSLKTTILQIREVAAGESVGYSRRTILTRPSRIAAIPIGYADGLDRHLGNRTGQCVVNGQRADYVGNICMDVCMIDVTDIPCQEGDTVEIFGEEMPVTELSDRLGTIPYEILTSVSDRVKRVYYQG